MQYETNETLKRFGQRLKELREKEKKSLNMFAYENDLSKASLSRIERGIIDLRFSTLIKIANALKMPLSDLLNMRNEQETK